MQLAIIGKLRRPLRREITPSYYYCLSRVKTSRTALSRVGRYSVDPGDRRKQRPGNTVSRPPSPGRLSRFRADGFPRLHASRAGRSTDGRASYSNANRSSTGYPRTNLTVNSTRIYVYLGSFLDEASSRRRNSFSRLRSLRTRIFLEFIRMSVLLVCFTLLPNLSC